MTGWEIPNANLFTAGYWDGDTADIWANWITYVAEPFGQEPARQSKTLQFRVRLAGINAAKLPTSAGKIAAQYVHDWCIREPFTVTSTGDHYKYGGPKYTPYAQFMADLTRNGQSLTSDLLDHLLAVFWDGKGTRPDDEGTAP